MIDVNRFILFIKIIILFLAFSMNSQPEIVAQKYISDTLIISVPADSNLNPLNASLYQFEDLTGDTSPVFRITQKNIFYFFPVDYYIIPDKTMEEYFTLFFNKDNSTSVSIKLHNFYMEEQHGWIFRRYMLNAEMETNLFDGFGKNNDTLSGRLLYQTKIPLRSGKKVSGGRETALLDSWEKEFATDLSLLVKNYLHETDSLPYNFRPTTHIFKTNLYSSARFVVGLNYWMIEGELIFSRPEAKPWFTRQGYLVRYRNNDVLESISFGSKSEHLNYRINENWIFDINSNLLLGVNKWKDIDEVDHPIWHVVMLNASLSQTIRYSPFSSKPSWIIGGGLMEDLYYIPDGDFRFNPGILLQLGYRF